MEKPPNSGHLGTSVQKVCFIQNALLYWWFRTSIKIAVGHQTKWSSGSTELSLCRHTVSAYCSIIVYTNKQMSVHAIVMTNQTGCVGLDILTNSTVKVIFEERPIL